MRTHLTNMLREPFLHFLLLGTLLFVAYAAVSDNQPTPGTIVVTRGHVESMRAVFLRTWQRPPTQEELKGLIDGYVREEVLYREGLAMGLERDDPVIRRRVRQKVDALSEDASLTEPSERDLQIYLDANRAKFVGEPLYTFRQVFVDPTKLKRSLNREIPQLLTELKRTGDTDAALRYGDTTMLPHRLETAPEREIAKVFGGEFSKELAAVAQGQWVGPIRSGYGLHLVFVSEKSEGRTAGLDMNREVVRREWEREQRVAATEKFYQQLLQRYMVKIEETRLADAPSDREKPQ